MAASAQPIKYQPIEPLCKRKEWKALETHYRSIRGLHLRDRFAKDPERGERLTAEAVGIFLDYSKNRITDETLKRLIRLAEESGLRAQIEAMFCGDKINVTENRPALHVALRAPKSGSIIVTKCIRSGRGFGVWQDGRPSDI